MLEFELKNIIAENCDYYEPRFNLVTMSVGRFCETCDNCRSFKGEKCSKNQFYKIRNIVSIN